MTIPKLRIGDVAEINPRPSRIPQLDEMVSFASMTDLSAERGCITQSALRPFAEVCKGYTPFRAQDVLVAKITPCFENCKIGEASIPTDIGYGSTEFHVIRPLPARLDRRYLLHFLRQPIILKTGERRMTGSAGQRRVPASFLEALEIPLPPLEEQRRIAAILDKAHEIQVADRKRRETLGRFRASYFRYLFGEPSKATENWSLKTIASCCKNIQTGPFGSLLHQSDYIQGGMPLINPKQIVNGVVSCCENETITEDKAEELSSYRLEEGDVLLARRGEMGRCAAITRRENGYLCGTGSMFLRPLRDAITPEYLSALLSSKHMRSKLERVAIGTTLLNLNSAIVGDVLIPVPPIGLQLRYTRFLARLDAIGDITSRSAFAYSAVLASIQNSIFPIAGS